MLVSSDFHEHEVKAAFRRFGEVDWDFPAQASESAFSAVHWHPCRFPSQIPAITVARMCAANATVLDPFMGSATTLVEAQRLGRPSIGVDINPVSCLLGHAKTLTADAAKIRLASDAIRLKLTAGWSTLRQAEVPETVQAEKWYMPRTLEGLRKLWFLALDLEGVAGALTRACFSAILLPACREDRHWGYVCDNTQPKSNREADARELFLVALTKMTAAYEERSKFGRGPFAEARIINGDARTALRELPDDHVGCVVTSPPYFGVADYLKAQRLTMEWLLKPIEQFRQQEIGARSKRHRRTALEDYLTELRGVFVEVHRIMQPSANAVIVFGQSPSRPDAQTRFVEMLEAIGLRLQLERRRHIPIGRRQKPSLVQETVLVVRK